MLFRLVMHQLCQQMAVTSLLGKETKHLIPMKIVGVYEDISKSCEMLDVNEYRKCSFKVFQLVYLIWNFILSIQRERNFEVLLWLKDVHKKNIQNYTFKKKKYSNLKLMILCDSHPTLLKMIKNEQWCIYSRTFSKKLRSWSVLSLTFFNGMHHFLLNGWEVRSGGICVIMELIILQKYYIFSNLIEVDRYRFPVILPAGALPHCWWRGSGGRSWPFWL